MDSITKPVILLGAGGHAKVLCSLLKLINVTIAGVCAPELVEQENDFWRDITILKEESMLNEYQADSVLMVNGIGQQHLRERIFNQFKAKGYFFPYLIHPHAYVDSMSKLHEGAQIMAGAIIQADATVGKNTIINTRASIDHDCCIGDHVHIAPGAVLCGGVYIDHRVFIGGGAILGQGIRVGEEACIGAGASIVRNVRSKQKVIPAALRHSMDL